MHHRRKMIAPIVVSVIMVIYYAVYFAVLIAVANGIWKYLLGIFPIAFTLLMIKVCLERIEEIRKGEEDDIGQY